MTKIWSIPGGVHPPENKAQSLQLPVGEIALPPLVIFPLNQHIGAPAEPVVHVGERVLAGQMIAQAMGPVSAPVHASTSGEVIAIEDHPVAHPSGMTSTCIVIRPDGKDEWVELNPCEDYTRLTHDQLLQKIRNAGIAGLGGAGFPTAIKLNPRGNLSVDTLIINGTECEPYITADDILMQTQADEVVAGTQLLAHILGDPANILIGIEDNKPKAIEALTTAARGTAIQVRVFPTKYPSGGEKQLIQILTGREVPSGKLPADIGAVCQNVGTAVAAWRAVRFGEPLVSRITTVVGAALRTQRNIRVRLGTPVGHVLAEHGFDAVRGSRLIMGGPMMGFALQSGEVPVVKTTNCILAPTAEEMPAPPPPQACIRCGLCAQACPASLLPQQLYWYAQAQDYERLQAHNLFDCIECGACSYVCPSNIPLVQYYRASKGTIRQRELDKQKSDRSRRRFEFRQERIAKAEAEKEAKRLARKEAAELAKQKLAAAKLEAGASPAAGAGRQPADIVAQAMAQAKSRQVSPEEQRAKLERAVTSVKGRLERVQQQLAEAENEGSDQVDKLCARVKEAEAKLRDAKRKLADFAPEETNPVERAPTTDPVAAAIARAQAKMAASPQEKLKASLDALQQRLAKAQEKLEAARMEGADTVDALQQGVDKLRTKIASTEAELEFAQAAPAAPKSEPAEDAAGAAIERARARARAQAAMSPEEKRRNQIESLRERLQKAEARLAKAESEGDANAEAFRSGVEKLRAKLADLEVEPHL